MCYFVHLFDTKCNIENLFFFRLLQDGDVTREEEENLLEKINEINFHLQMLETRLNRHRNLVPIRYEMLMDHLQQSPHLAILRDDSK